VCTEAEEGNTCWLKREAMGLRRRGTALPILWSGEMRLLVEGEVVLC